MTEPARAAGASFDPEAAKALIADLSKVSTETPEGELSEESGPFVEPLMLQVACYQLWATLLEKKKGGVDHVSVKDVAEHAAVGDALGKYYAEPREESQRTVVLQSETFATGLKTSSYVRA